MGEDSSKIKKKAGIMARIRSFALNILRAGEVVNIKQALYRNAINLDNLFAY